SADGAGVQPETARNALSQQPPANRVRCAGDSLQSRSRDDSSPQVQCHLERLRLALMDRKNKGSVANYRKQESLDSQVIDFPIHGFLILPRKGNFATEPSHLPGAYTAREAQPIAV